MKDSVLLSRQRALALVSYLQFCEFTVDLTFFPYVSQVSVTFHSQVDLNEMKCKVAPFLCDSSEVRTDKIDDTCLGPCWVLYVEYK